VFETAACWRRELSTRSIIVAEGGRALNRQAQRGLAEGTPRGHAAICNRVQAPFGTEQVHQPARSGGLLCRFGARVIASG
jgi:hypothetical protein